MQGHLGRDDRESAGVAGLIREANLPLIQLHASGQKAFLAVK
jgi:hypothetical protein